MGSLVVISSGQLSTNSRIIAKLSQVTDTEMATEEHYRRYRGVGMRDCDPVLENYIVSHAKRKTIKKSAESWRV